MSKVNFNTAFKGLTDKDVKLWIVINRHKLVGSAVFTRNKSFTSKLVQWAENWGKKDKKCFTPSHTGSIIEYKNQLWVFDIKPPRSTMTKLSDYIENTKDEFCIVLRDYKINTDTFNALIIDRLGERYAYMSALRSVFSKWNTKYAQHCSENFARTTVMSGHNFSEGFKLECTPDELYHEMINKKIIS